MTHGVIIDFLESLITKAKSSDVTKTIETDVEVIGAATFNYIKTNGLQDLYQIALTVLTAAIPGASWTGILASIEAQAITDGKQLITGASAVVASQAQADLIAAGKLLAPVSAPAAAPAA